MSDKAPRKARKRRSLNLDLPGEGIGLAERARRLLGSRQRSVDAAVEAAVRGEDAARIRRMREGQSTDNSQ